MLISFFEEFPTKTNLDKIKLLNFPTKLYIAAPSLKEFNKLKSQIKSKYVNDVKDFIYWPTLKRKEGYWFSPLSKNSALKRTLNEIPQNFPTMLDLELPTAHNPLLYLTQLLNFFRNKELITNFIKNHKHLYTAEYFPIKIWMKFLALNFNPRIYKNKVIKMLYSSLWPFSKNFLDKKLKQGKEKFQSNFIPAFGVIATGIGGNEPLISPKKLERDLTLAKKNKIQEVIIFRLGGLNKSYLKIISKFT